MIIDLSHMIETGMPCYPGTLAPSIHETCSLDADGFKEIQLEFPTHTGTHIDVPAHLFEAGRSVDSFECSKFYGNAKVIDCKNATCIDGSMIAKVINRNEKPDFLLFYTGWADFWGDDRYFDHFPLLTPDAVELICQSQLKGIGIDAISFDAVGNDALPNHKILLRKEIILIENLCNLELLIDKNFILSCFPLKIKAADGSPVRACAIIN